MSVSNAFHRNRSLPRETLFSLQTTIEFISAKRGHYVEEFSEATALRWLLYWWSIDSKSLHHSRTFLSILPDFNKFLLFSPKKFSFLLNNSLAGLKILYPLQKGKKPLPQKWGWSRYDTKLYLRARLQFWKSGERGVIFRCYYKSSLWPREGVPVRVPSMGQIDVKRLFVYDRTIFKPEAQGEITIVEGDPVLRINI